MGEVVTAKQIAELLDGMEYPVRIPSRVVRQAKEAGLVIVYGSSDDLMEFEGAITDEVGAYEGTTVQVDTEGPLPDFENLDKDDEGELEKYFKRKGKGKTIEAMRCEESVYSWTYKTDLPCETFEVVEDGAPYCRGIVFRLSDCA